MVGCFSVSKAHALTGVWDRRSKLQYHMFTLSPAAASSLVGAASSRIYSCDVQLTPVARKASPRSLSRLAMNSVDLVDVASLCPKDKQLARALKGSVALKNSLYSTKSQPTSWQALKDPDRRGDPLVCTQPGSSLHTFLLNKLQAADRDAITELSQNGAPAPGWRVGKLQLQAHKYGARPLMWHLVSAEQSTTVIVNFSARRPYSRSVKSSAQYNSFEVLAEEEDEPPPQPQAPPAVRPHPDPELPPPAGVCCRWWCDRTLRRTHHNAPSSQPLLCLPCLYVYVC